MYPLGKRDSYADIVDEIPPSLESPIKSVGKNRGRYASSWVEPDNVGLCTPEMINIRLLEEDRHVDKLPPAVST